MTVACISARPGASIVCALVPETTWALVTMYPGPTGNPLPVTRPPQPRLATLTTDCLACMTPGVSTAAGTGNGAGSEPGSRPANTGEKLTPDRIPSTLARKAGGLGAALSSVCSTTDR